MPITYTNRKGTTYTLCRSTTKTGKLRYSFAKQPKGEVVEAIPDGWMVRESVNGVVSLVKQRPQQITELEVASVRAALKRHPNGSRYRADAKDDQIVVYEQQGPEVDRILGIFGMSASTNTDAARNLQARMDSHSNYSPILRFSLVNEEKRTFTAERMSFRSSWEGWFDVHRSGQIGPLAKETIPLLGTDDFFDLW